MMKFANSQKNEISDAELDGIVGGVGVKSPPPLGQTFGGMPQHSLPTVAGSLGASTGGAPADAKAQEVRASETNYVQEDFNNISSTVAWIANMLAGQKEGMAALERA